MIYPESHPKAKELNEVKARINKSFNLLKEKQVEARKHYTDAMNALREMGLCHAQVHNEFKSIVTMMEELEAVVVSPLI